MAEIDNITPISRVTNNGVEIPLAKSGGGELYRHFLSWDYNGKHATLFLSQKEPFTKETLAKYLSDNGFTSFETAYPCFNHVQYNVTFAKEMGLFTQSSKVYTRLVSRNRIYINSEGAIASSVTSANQDVGIYNALSDVVTQIQ